MTGVDLRTIQDLGARSSLDLVQRYSHQRYSHLSPGHKAEAVERITPELIEAQADTMRLTATDPEVAARVSVPARVVGALQQLPCRHRDGAGISQRYSQRRPGGVS